MTARLLARFRRAARRAIPSAARRPASGSARRAVAFGAVAFGLLTLGLIVAAETIKPEWRDPEYGHRARAARRWQRDRPDRPLVLAVGSSRTEYGISPADMDFPDEPGSPLVFNFGYSGAFPLGMWLQLARAFDDGLKPSAVLVELAYAHVRVDGAAEDQFPKWGPRLSEADLRRLAPYTNDPTAFRRELTAARRDPWVARRPALVSDLLPDWQIAAVRSDHDRWEGMDRYGRIFLLPERVTDDSRRRLWASVHANAPAALTAGPPGAVSDRALRDLAAACRARGVAVAFFWAPESPAFRALYTPAARACIDDYSRALARDLGVPVFPAPGHLPESDFPDGFHLFPAGAATYSRWLADHHLRPWLASTLK